MDWLWTSIGGLIAILFVKFVWPFLVSAVISWTTKKAAEQLANKKDDFIGQMLRNLNSVSTLDSLPIVTSGISKEQFEEETEKINRKLDLIVRLLSPQTPPPAAAMVNNIEESEDDIMSTKPIENKKDTPEPPMPNFADLLGGILNNKDLMQNMMQNITQVANKKDT